MINNIMSYTAQKTEHYHFQISNLNKVSNGCQKQRKTFRLPKNPEEVSIIHRDIMLETKNYFVCEALAKRLPYNQKLQFQMKIQTIFNTN